MKIAVQDGLLPGSDLLEKFQFAKSCGFEGIEPNGARLLENLDAYREASEATGLPVCSICAGYRGTFLSPDPDVRGQAVDDCRKLLKAAGMLGATGLIVVPIFGPPQLPDLMPMADAVQLELDLLDAVLREELAPVADEAGTLVLLEPLNRYETHLLNRLEEAVRVLRRVGQPGLGIMADFFHMHIEEVSTPEAILKAGEHIRHVHLADNTRIQPGTGDTDFRAGFEALKQIGFDGFMALECRLTGDPAETLPETARHLRDLVEKA